ncbi:MAG: hypothetical protein PVJ84_19760 [Desulfobacteraceae bacterium]
MSAVAGAFELIKAVQPSEHTEQSVIIGYVEPDAVIAYRNQGIEVLVCQRHNFNLSFLPGRVNLRSLGADF